MKIIMGILAAVSLFLGYVSTRNGQFRYERSDVIAATPERIFPYLSDLKIGATWNPFALKDPKMKSTFTGPGNQVGSAMDFEGNSEAGTGRLEITKIIPNERVEIRLMMTQPLTADNLIEYRLTPEGAGTRFTWAMSGDGGFMGKLVTLFMDCEKMVAGEFVKGIATLKGLVEAKTPKRSSAGEPQVVGFSRHRPARR